MKYYSMHCLFVAICMALMRTSSKGVKGDCLFPEYLQSERDEFGEPLPWHSRMWWLNLRNAPKLREKQDIYVHRSQIWSQRQNNRRSCERHMRRMHHRATSFGNCSERYLVYNRTCLMEEGRGRFRVIQYGPGGSPSFLCMTFERRSANIVQVQEGPAMENNEHNLCDESKLVLDEWPWIAPWKRDLVNCPISGGFRFRTLNRLTNEDFCEDEWRKSQLEVECSAGDGLNFIAPRGSTCNPFSSEEEVTRLYCWAGWHMMYYSFLVVGDASGTPQYCLRFPRDMSGDFTVMVYFSVLCPLDPDGMPQTGIEYYEMKMSTVDPDRCYDDDPDKCQHIAKKGACSKENKFAIHCQETCGYCEDKKAMMKMMCPFSSKVHGVWIFQDRYHTEKVHINYTMVQFADFGSFSCKERSVSSDMRYKTVSYFNNGCSMRFTCLELDRKNNNILQFKMGKSFRTDVGFDEMCTFEDNSYPIDFYRRKEMTNLILDGRLWDAFCGLSGSLTFNGTIYGEECAGTVSDWDEDGCVTRGNLAIRSSTCSVLSSPNEYQCLGLLSDNILEQFIITKSRNNDDYNCWVLTSFLCDSWKWPYRALFKLDSPQCVPLAESACILQGNPEALLFINDGEKTKRCKGEVTIPSFSSVISSSSTLDPDMLKDDNTKKPDMDRLPYIYPDPGEPGATIYPLTHRPWEAKGGSSSINCYSALLIIVSLAVALTDSVYLYILQSL